MPHLKLHASKARSACTPHHPEPSRLYHTNEINEQASRPSSRPPLVGETDGETLGGVLAEGVGPCRTMRYMHTGGPALFWLWPPGFGVAGDGSGRGNRDNRDNLWAIIAMLVAVVVVVGGTTVARVRSR